MVPGALTDSVKRIVVLMLGLAIAALDKKLGLNLDESSKLALAGMVAAFLGQSAWHSVAKVKAMAAAKADEAVKDVDDAAAVFNAGNTNISKALIGLLVLGLLVPTAARAEDPLAFQPEHAFLMKPGQLRCADAPCLNFTAKLAMADGEPGKPADPPADAINNKPMAVRVKEGDTVPVDGLLLPEELAKSSAKRVVQCETERDILRANGPAWWPIAVGVLAGGLLGAGVVLYLKR